MCRVWNNATEEPPEDAVYVGRPTKWGNPFVIGEHGTREEVIEKYQHWLGQRPELIRAARHELAGRHLVCWCAPEPCHADVLLAVANPHLAESPAAYEKLVRDLRLRYRDDLRTRRGFRTCPYCGAGFQTLELYRQHVRRANRTGWCMGSRTDREP